MATITINLVPDDYLREMHLHRWNTDSDTALFEWALDHRDSYQTAAQIVVDQSGEDAAEEAFDLTNNPSRDAERHKIYGRQRSVSVGDIVTVTEADGTSTEWLCDSIGWRELKTLDNSDNIV